ncbi:MAG: hypothetical protein PUH85_02570 [Firmicutes bacterium]|nr:hypothetical protein [Bacillota bacterium]
MKSGITPLATPTIKLPASIKGKALPIIAEAILLTIAVSSKEP